MTEHLAFYEQFPLLVPESLDPLKAQGFLEVNGGLVEIRIDATGTQTYSTDIVHSTKDVMQHLESERTSLNVRFQQCTGALTFMQELHHALQPLSRPPATDTSAYPPIIRALDMLGWDNVTGFASDKLTLTIHDHAGRTHQVTVDFAKQQIASSIETGAVPITVDLARHVAGLRQKCIAMEECWAVLDSVDEDMCVLVPEHPRRYDLWRRISLGELVTGHLEVSADRPVPRITVYGPRARAEALNARARGIRSRWDLGRSVRENLEGILQVELPQKGVDKGEANIQCGICFAFRNGDECADQTCSNDHCAQPFHRQCLVKWLTSKEDTRQSYDTYFGRCPYCSSNISVAASRG